MSDLRTRSAIVVGAGIGGLAAAVALQRAGIDVTLCERAPNLRAAGFGLSVQGNAMNGLRTLGMGLDEELLRVGGRVRTFRFHTSDGALLRRREMAQIDANLGAPSVALARSDLHSTLLNALGLNAAGLNAAGTNVRVEVGARAVHFENAADRVVLRLADGRDVEADILVGADGIDSVVRAQLHGAAEPRPGGFISWLALAPFLHPAVAEGDSVHYWGPGMRVGIHDIGHDRTYWWASMSTAPELAANWPHGRADVLRRFRGWSPEIGEIISATAEYDILALPIYDRRPLSWWGRGRVTLLGDAAHPMLPSLGQGANAAIEDALVLAHALTLHTDPDSALRSYERRRLGRTTALVTRSRLLAGIEKYTNPAAVAGRNALLRHVSEKRFIDLFTMAMHWPGFGDRERSAPLPRPLAPLERWHWTVDQVAPLHIISRVRVSGRIEVSVVRAALDVLAHRHPLLRATIWSDRGANPQFVADHRPIPLRLVPHGDWVSEIDHELRARFDPRGPLLRATLITVETDVHDLILTSTYSIADCATVISLARQLLEFAADPPGRWVPEVPTLPGAERLIPKDFRGARGKGRALVRLASAAAGNVRAAPVRLTPETWVPPKERYTRLAHRSVSGHEWDALRAACRDRRILPESAIGAALAMAAGTEAVDGQSPISLAVSVPFREHLAEPIGDDSIGSFQAMTIAIPVAQAPGQSFWQTAEPFDDELHDRIRRRHHLSALNAIPLLTPRTPAKIGSVVKLLDSRGPGNLCLTFLDVTTSPTQIGDLTLSGVQFMSGMSISGCAMLTATGGRDELALNLGYTEGMVTPDRAETLLENTTCALRKAAAEALSSV